MRARVTVTVDQAHLGAVDAACRALHLSRSRVVEDALILWEKQRRERELEAGYAAMRDENLGLAEATLPSWAETERRS
jgi:metal-responsive CopG/Arc/MetJ family transcriptional regulator